MGILNGCRLITPHLKKIDLVRGTEINIYVDGPIIAHKGITSFTDNTPEELIKAATFAENYLHRVIASIGAHLIIKNIYIYFDGQPPKIKLNKCHKRAKINKIHSTELSRRFKTTLLSHKHFKIISLTKGESEFQMVFRRDTNIPSLMITNDSDILVILYKYVKMSEHDVVYVKLKSDEFYDLSQTLLPYSKATFTLLTVFAGCDFVDSIFSNSMVHAALDIVNIQRTLESKAGHDEMKKKFTEAFLHLTRNETINSKIELANTVKYLIVVIFTFKYLNLGNVSFRRPKEQIFSINKLSNDDFEPSVFGQFYNNNGGSGGGGGGDSGSSSNSSNATDTDTLLMVNLIWVINYFMGNQKSEDDNSDVFVAPRDPNRFCLETLCNFKKYQHSKPKQNLYALYFLDWKKSVSPSPPPKC